MFLSRGDRDLGVAFQTHPGRQAFISSGSKEPRSALELAHHFFLIFFERKRNVRFTAKLSRKYRVVRSLLPLHVNSLARPHLDILPL